MSNRIEIVSEDLAAELTRCPTCNGTPQIFKRLTGCPPRPQVAIACLDCEGYENGIYHEIAPSKGSPWHDSLYLAVSVWTTVAKLVAVPKEDTLTYDVEQAPEYDQEFYDRQDS